MLFNSYIFILAFLPVTLAIFFAIGARSHHRAAVGWLVITSLFFYGWWNPQYVGLIVASMLFNYSLGSLLPTRSTERTGRWLLIFGLAANLALLGYYKYSNFFVEQLNKNGLDLPNPPIILPLAISFFTFQQIAYLVDTYRGETKEYNFLHYCLFVTFFPQLIAGPIVHHKEMLPQFAVDEIYRPNRDKLFMGASIFAMGLFKKVILADGVAVYATPVFDAASIGTSLTIFEAWGGALAYTFQLYFDFSAYSDMAVGLGLMFGIHLPLNFYSPYKAVNIIDFWRRWHITLSRFLRDYIYIPLGGNRRGTLGRYRNLLVTMLLGGLWHGAGWTFILWGGYHGLLLSINHGWHALRSRMGLHPRAQESALSNATAISITFVAVVVGWVLFRSEDMNTAVSMYRAMFGYNGIALPETLIGRLGDLETTLVDMGITFNGMFGNRVFPVSGIAWLLSIGSITWLAPNLQDMFGKSAALRTNTAWTLAASSLQWKPSLAWAVITGVAAGLGILGISRASEFLYFQF